MRHLAVLLLTLPLAGCGAFSPPEAEFVLRAQTEELDSKVRTAVAKEMDETFGTPHALVAWLKLPVDYGGYAGVTRTSKLAGKIKSLSVRFEDDQLAKFTEAFADKSGNYSFPDAGLQLTWLSGPLSGTAIPVIGYNPEKRELALDEAIEPHPPADTPFVLQAGETLKYGRRLYMTHCMHCHGASGDGAGPTAKYLNPLPRDYRLGQFKFKSTRTDQKTSREDLKRIILNGIPGTYMPSFLLLKEDESHAIVEYIRWLGMRGELENSVVINELRLDFSKDAIKQRSSEEGSETSDEINESVSEVIGQLPEFFDSYGDDMAELWAAADEEDSLIVPAVARIEDSLESRVRGRRFFLEKCATCHGHTGRGDGQMTIDFQKNTEDPAGGLYPIPGLHDIWGHQVKPRNLMQGVFRGGRRPIDLYYRLYGGITASKMPAFNTAEPELLWDTVNYVLHIPYETPADKAAYKTEDDKYEAELKAAPPTAEGATPPTGEATTTGNETP